MNTTDDFLAKYFKQREDGTFEFPPLTEPDPDVVQAMNRHLAQIEIEERLYMQETAQMRFVG